MLILSWLRGRTTEEEDRELCDWIESDPDNLEYFSQVRAVDSFLKNRQGGAALNKSAKPHAWKRLVWVSAAAAAAFSGIFAVARYVVWSDSGRDMVTCSNDSEPSILIDLPDGSRIWLAENSSVSYASEGFSDDRTLLLEGEAMFDVASDSLHPFVVHGPDMDVEVLGTVFNVVDCAGDGTAETTLAEGRVLLHDPDGQELIVLRPGQKAVYHSDTKRVDISDVPTSGMLMWRDGVIFMENVTIRQIKARLEEDFRTNLRIAGGGPEGGLFTLSYVRTARLDDVLDMVETISGYVLVPDDGPVPQNGMK